MNKLLLTQVSLKNLYWENSKKFSIKNGILNLIIDYFVLIGIRFDPMINAHNWTRLSSKHDLKFNYNS